MCLHGHIFLLTDFRIRDRGVAHGRGDHSRLSCTGNYRGAGPRSVMTSYDKNQTDTNQENIWIFLDDSYIWIEAKTESAKLKSRYKLTTTEDHRICISVGGLIETVVRNNRNIKESILYGSEPPLIDSVWKRAEEYGFKVKCHHKNKAAVN